MTSVFIVEHTICFETNFTDAATRKANKYEDLVEACGMNRFHTSLITLDVESRGFLNIDGFTELIRVCRPPTKPDRMAFLTSVEREAILGSHKIWTLRNKST